MEIQFRSVKARLCHCRVICAEPFPFSVLRVWEDVRVSPRDPTASWATARLTHEEPRRLRLSEQSDADAVPRKRHKCLRPSGMDNEMSGVQTNPSHRPSWRHSEIPLRSFASPEIRHASGARSRGHALNVLSVDLPCKVPRLRSQWNPKDLTSGSGSVSANHKSPAVGSHTILGKRSWK